MSDAIIIFLLSIIAYFLYQITKQLSYLTGRRFKLRWNFPRVSRPKKKVKQEEIEEKLTN